MNNYKKILIAEDDQDDYVFLSETLHEINADFKLLKATNGLQVMGFLNSADVPDIIFLDLHMPIRNGIATIQLIKAIPEFKDIPIIIFTSSTYYKAIDEAYKHEAHYFIVKPVSQIFLYDQLLFLFNELIKNPSRPDKDHFVIDQKQVKETVNKS